MRTKNTKWFWIKPLRITAIFFYVVALLAPISGYGAVVFAAEPEFTIVTTDAVTVHLVSPHPYVSNDIIAFTNAESSVLGYYDIQPEKTHRPKFSLFLQLEGAQGNQPNLQHSGQGLYQR